MSDLIDTTEMYLRTIFELAEEGITPMRARIAERLGQSGPTVSQTVARMQRDGLVELDEEDRHLVLTPPGALTATRVMRKHRLAECLLVQVIGLPWAHVHPEACRWEHVMSEAVERRLVLLLGRPTVSPFGNPIPGLAELTDEDGPELVPQQPGDGSALSAATAAGSPARVTVLRITERLQSDEPVMAALHEVGATPGEQVDVVAAANGVRIGDVVDLSEAQAGQIIVATG